LFGSRKPKSQEEISVRKLWYAGAVVASGFVLFGATPAQADLLPGSGTAEQQADERLADLLGQSNGINLENPLRYSTLGQTPVGNQPVMQFRAGNNSPDLNPLLPGESTTEEPRPGRAAADVVGHALRQPGTSVADQPVGLQQNPLSGVLGGLPIWGLLPNGGQPSGLSRPTQRQTETFDGGMPLLGGLGGLLPVNDGPRTLPADGKPDITGLPAGGLAIVPAQAVPAAGQTPAAQAPAAAQAPTAAQAPVAQAPADPATQAKPAQDTKDQKPKPVVTPDDPRLHEEPVDGEASHRQFSADGRPIAGVDQQYK
jgi:hypothetical protein